MVELYINEELIDLSVDQVLAMTYQVNNIGDIKNQRANFSNQFKIPKTKENCRKFGFIDQVTSADMRPYRALPARIIQDGEEIVRNGVAQVLSVDDTINVVIYSGIKDFFETIGDAKLSDLDLSDLNHTWDEATINALRGSESGICYPILDYGAGYEPQYQFFGIYVKTLFERIFAAADFEFYGSFLDHPVFPKLIIPFANDKYLSPEDLAKNSFAARGSFLIGACYTHYHIVGQATSGSICPSVPGLTDITGNANGAFDGSTFTVGANSVRGNLKLKGTGQTVLGNTFWVKLVSNNKGVLWRFKSNPEDDVVQRFSVDVPKSDYLPGEEIHIEVASAGGNVTFELQLEFIADEEVVFGSTVDVARNLPEMKQKDFLKAIAHMFGLIYEQDENLQRVRIRQFDEIQTNKGVAIDWSDKLHVPLSDDDNRKPQIVFEIGYAQRNHFRYKEDDGVTEGYGDGVITVDNQNLAPDKTVIELPFAATENEQILQFEAKEDADFVSDAPSYSNSIDYEPGMCALYEGRLVRWKKDNLLSSHEINQFGVTTDPIFYGHDNPLTEDTLAADQSWSNGEHPHPDWLWDILPVDMLVKYKRATKTEPRIMVAEKIGSSIFPYFIKPGGQFNLGFADSLLKKNYKTVADITEKTKFVKAHFNLSGNDVKNIDYLIPRYVSIFGGFFYINRIEKFRKGRTTLVHLVRV